MARFLQKRGDAGRIDPYLYPWTQALADRGDMIEVADPADTKRRQDATLSLTVDESEVLTITSMKELKAYAASRGLDLSGDSKNVKTLQREIIQLIAAQEESELPDAEPDETDGDGPFGADT